MAEIKYATSIHIDSLVKLFAEYLEFYEIKNNIHAIKAFLLERLKKKDSIIFLAFEEQVLAGFIQIYPSFSTVALKPIWLINDLFVDPEMRNKGTAKKLIKAVENDARKKKIFTLKLATQTNNYVANGLYQSLNFQLNDNFNFYSKRIVNR